MKSNKINDEKVNKLFDEAIAKISDKKPKSALPLLQEAYLLDKNNHKIISALALCYMLTNDYDNAIELYKKAIEINPNDTKQYYYLGKLYTETNKHVEAMSILSTGIYKCKEKLKKKLDIFTLIDLARIYSFQNNYEESILVLFKALKLDDLNYEVHTLLAEQYYHIKLYKDAIYEADRAIQINPKEYEAYLYAGLSYHKLNILSKALEYFSKALEINQNQPELKSLHNKIIELKSKSGKTIEEIIFYSKEVKRYKGVVKWFNDNDGIGYIKCYDDNSEVFVHYLAINKKGYQTIYEGDEVEFSIDMALTGKVAVNIDVISTKSQYVKKGKVKWYDEDRGVGEIILENQEVVPFHFTAIIKDGIKTIENNTLVQCELFETENGMQAFNVLPIENNEFNNKQESLCYYGVIKWIDKNKNIGIIEEQSSKFQAIFKPLEVVNTSNLNIKNIKSGLKVKFKTIDIESLQSENVKKAIEVEIINE